MQSITYKIFGHRGVLPAAQQGIKDLAMIADHSAVAAKGSNFGQIFQLEQFLEDLKQKKIVFFGEMHSVEKVVALEQEVLLALSQPPTKVNVVMEHFSFEMQGLLDGYQSGDLNMDQLLQGYAQIGTEGHDLKPYASILEHAKQNKDFVKLHAGFIPRTYARTLVRQGEAECLKESIAKDYLAADLQSFEGSDFHYNMFESMISGRNMHDPDQQPNPAYKNIFKAQLMKDYSMAHYICKLLKNDTEDQKYLILAGKGHQQHYCGVPELVFKTFPEMKDNSSLVVIHESDYEIDLDQNDETVLNGIKQIYGPEGSNAADYLYIYEEDAEEEQEEGAEQKQEEEKEGENVKQETAAAYDKVGSTAHLKGNIKKAKAVMEALGYSEEEFEVAGQDAYNFQGVGNPHRLAKIQPGEKILDIGSGLGVDSFIAQHYTGASGKVVGIDISKKEIAHCQKRAEERGLNMKFLAADMENIPLPDNMIDVIISNGAFCLAPNKEKAFSEIFRVLKPGGRMSVCTSSVKVDLQPGVNWPVCMQMFAHITSLEPMCSKIGFENVQVDDSNPLMEFELPEADGEEATAAQTENGSEVNAAEQAEGAEAEEQEGQVVEKKEENATQNQSDAATRAKNQVHVGSAEFAHLQNYNMNELCARVIVFGTKPNLEGKQE